MSGARARSVRVWVPDHPARSELEREPVPELDLVGIVERGQRGLLDDSRSSLRRSPLQSVGIDPSRGCGGVTGRPPVWTTHRQLRRARELTQADMAVRVGIHINAYNAIENGRSIPSLNTAKAIAAVFSEPVETVFDYVKVAS